LDERDHFPEVAEQDEQEERAEERRVAGCVLADDVTIEGSLLDGAARGAEAVRLCGIAVDYDTRVVAPNDCIDTDDDSWEEDVISACRDHVGHNSQTSKRLKQKMMNRFQKRGGLVTRV
jgi:hypothetical protein